MEEEPKLSDLEKFLNKKVMINIKDGHRLSGILSQYDEHMNLILGDVEEYFNDKLVGRHKLTFVKGGNLRTISLLEGQADMPREDPTRSASSS
ncbi:MAG: LSM domain-containing protein [Candidatus Hadarchaeales archaeon]